MTITASARAKLSALVKRLDADASMTIAVVAALPLLLVALNAFVGFMTSR